MARTAIPIQTIPSFGDGLADISWTAADAANDHEFVNDGKTLLLIKNDDASPKSVDVLSASGIRTIGEQVTKTTATAATKQSVVGPFKQEIFNQDGDGGSGMVLVNIAADTSLSFAAVRMTPSP